MQTQLYPPATVYQTPAKAPFEFCIDTIFVNELLASPSIKRMLEEAVPMFDRIIQSPLLKPHLSNFTLRSLSDFGIISADLLEDLDQRLRNWPEDDRPLL